MASGGFDPFRDMFSLQDSLVRAFGAAHGRKGSDKETAAGSRTPSVDVFEDHRLVQRAYGQFQRTFTPPETVDAEHVSGEPKDGVLAIRSPLPVPFLAEAGSLHCSSYFWFPP